MSDRNYWTIDRGRRYLRRHILRGTALGGAGVVTALVVGCAGREKAAPETRPLTREPRRGGTIGALSTIGETPHQDPHQTASLTLHDVGMGVVYSRLLRWKLEEGVYPDAILPDGDLAEKWEQPDPQTYVFSLQRGVKWHNIPPVNGRELVAQDIIFSFDRQIKEKTNASFLEGLEKMEAVDRYTLRFTLSRPDADFLLMLADVHNKIVAQEAVELRGDLKQGPTIGTGPWLFQEWQPNQVVRVSRNPEYFRPGLPYADGMVLLRIQDPQTQQAAFRTQQVHVIDRVNRQIQDLLRRDVPNLQVIDAKLYGGTGGIKVWLHTEKPPTSDIRVRQAISKTIDRESFIRTVMFGSAWLASGVFLPALDWHLPEADLKKLLGQDLTEARRLLSAAGVSTWSPGMKNMNTPPDSLQSGELLVSQLRAVNISPTVSVIDNIRMLEEVWTRGDFEVALGPQQPQSATNVLLRRFYKTGGAQNGGRLSDRLLDDLIEKQATIVGDPQGRKQVLMDVQRRIIELAAIIPIYAYTEESAIWPTLKGYFQARSGDYSRWEKAWLDI